MKRILAALICGLWVSAASAQTIDALTPGAALTGTEKIPMFQTANPSVTTTPAAIKTFVNAPASCGSTTGQICYNNAGAFAGDPGLTDPGGIGAVTITNSSANTTPLTISGQSLTGSDTHAGISYAGTWNTSAGPTALSVSITNTASTGGLLLNLLAGAGGATSEFKVDTSGNVTSSSINAGGNITASAALTAGATASIGLNGRGQLTSTGAASIKLGPADAATAAAQTFGVQGIVAGTSNVGGGGLTISGPVATGSGTPGDVIVQTSATGAAATTQNALVTAITFKGANQNIVFGAGVTTGTNADFLCLAAGGIVTLQTSACTISSARFKQNIEPLHDDALAELGKIDVVSFNMKPQAEPNRDNNFLRTQIGVTAENVAAVDKRLAIFEQDGVTPKSYRQESMIALELAAIKQLASRMKTLEARR